MDLFKWLTKHIHPPGLQRPNRRSLYKVIAKSNENLLESGNSIFRNHFPALCSDERLAEHGEARKIPWFTFDTNDTYREKLAAGSFTLESTGEYGTFADTMDQLFPDRWKHIEYPEEGFTVGYSAIGKTRIGGDSRLIVFIKDMSQDDYDHAYEFLDWFLGADIEIEIIEWQYVSYPPVTMEELRENGGSSWLTEQLEDITDASCEVMPDDAFSLGQSLVPTRIWGDTEMVLIYVDEAQKARVYQRLEVVLDESVPRTIIES